MPLLLTAVAAFLAFPGSSIDRQVSQLVSGVKNTGTKVNASGGALIDSVIDKPVLNLDVKANAANCHSNPDCSCVDANGRLYSLATTAQKDKFKDCKELVELVMPEVKNIQSKAFKGCTGLTAINLPKLETMDIHHNGGPFQGCTNVETISLPKLGIGSTDNNIGDVVNDFKFPESLPKLRSLSIPSVRRVRSGTFQDCVKLTHVDLTSVEEIDKESFKNTKIEGPLYMPHLTEIGKGAFNPAYLNTAGNNKIGSVCVKDKDTLEMDSSLTNPVFPKNTDIETCAVCEDSDHSQLAVATANSAGWLASGQLESCATACSAKGLTCKVAEAAKESTEALTCAAGFNALLVKLGLPQCTDNWDSSAYNNPNVPNFDVSPLGRTWCALAAQIAPAQTCDATTYAPDDAEDDIKPRRLCYCSVA